MSTVIGQGTSREGRPRIAINYYFRLQIGEFGVVYKGYMKSEMMDTVAIKTLKGKLIWKIVGE